MEALNRAVGVLKQKKLLPDNFTLPAIYLCDKESYRLLLGAHTRNSDLPGNVTRGLVAYQPFTHVIYISLEEANEAVERELLTKAQGEKQHENNDVLFDCLMEELIHAITGVYTKTGLNLGFVTVPNATLQMRMASGVYSFTLNQNEFIDADGGLSEGLEALCTTESLTRIAVLMLSPNPTICFLDTNTPPPLLFNKDSLDAIFHRNDGRKKKDEVADGAFARALIKCMRTGDMISIKEYLLKPIIEALEQNSNNKQPLLALIKMLTMVAKTGHFRALDINQAGR